MTAVGTVPTFLGMSVVGLCCPAQGDPHTELQPSPAWVARLHTEDRLIQRRRPSRDATKMNEGGRRSDYGRSTDYTPSRPGPREERDEWSSGRNMSGPGSGPGDGTWRKEEPSAISFESRQRDKQSKHNANMQLGLRGLLEGRIMFFFPPPLSKIYAL